MLPVRMSGSKRTSVPALVTAEDGTLSDSADIVLWASNHSGRRDGRECVCVCVCLCVLCVCVGVCFVRVRCVCVCV